MLETTCGASRLFHLIISFSSLQTPLVSMENAIITNKRLCDGLGVTLKEFFETQEFEEPEQEIK